MNSRAFGNRLFLSKRSGGFSIVDPFMGKHSTYWNRRFLSKGSGLFKNRRGKKEKRKNRKYLVPY